MSTLSSRPSSQSLDLSTLPMMHLELWVAKRSNRARLARTLGRLYGVARQVTNEGGGWGPWVFLVEPEPTGQESVRLREILGVTPEEDLWVEFVCYASKSRMRSIIRRIWKNPQVVEASNELDGLISTRKPGYRATLAHARLIRI